MEKGLGDNTGVFGAPNPPLPAFSNQIAATDKAQVGNPPKGTIWVRAASRTAKGKSDYTTPVSIIIV